MDGENPFAQQAPSTIEWCAWEILKAGETLTDDQIADRIKAQGLRDYIAKQLGDDPRFEQAPEGGWRLAPAAPPAAAGEGSASPSKKRKASVELDLVDGPGISRPPKHMSVAEEPGAPPPGEDEEIDICNPIPATTPTKRLAEVTEPMDAGHGPIVSEQGGPTAAANGQASDDHTKEEPTALPPQETAGTVARAPEVAAGHGLSPEPSPQQPAEDPPRSAAVSPEKAPPGSKKPPLSPTKPAAGGSKPFMIPKRKAPAPAGPAAPVAPPATATAGGSPAPAAQMPSRPASRSAMESPTKAGRTRDGARWGAAAGGGEGGGAAAAAGSQRDQSLPPNLADLPIGDLRRPQSLQNLDQAGAGAAGGSAAPRAVSPRPATAGAGAAPQPWEMMLKSNKGAFASAWKRLEWPRSSTSLPQHKDPANATGEERAAWEAACQRFGGGAGPSPLQQDPYPPAAPEFTYVRIMQCNTATERQCLDTSVFVSNHHADTDGIDPGRTLILLHNFDKRLVYGAWRATEVGRRLDPSWSAEWPFHVRVQRVAEFTPLPSSMLEAVVPRRVNPRDQKPMKFFEKGTAAVREVWQMLQFYSGKGFRPTRDR